VSSEKPLIFFDPYPRNEAMVYTADVVEALSGVAQVITHFGSRADDAVVESVLADVAIIVGQTAMPKERLDCAPKLKGILNVKANWEPNIDYMEAHRRGIHVLSAAPAMAPAVAEYCIAQAISLGRGLQPADRLFRKGAEAYGIAGNISAYSLYDADVALVGYGNLGRALAPLLKPFGCRLKVYDPWISDSYLRSQGLMPASLEETLSSCQFLFLLAGVTSDNEEFLNRNKLLSISRDASVILASRAEIVEFDAFLELAGQGHFRAAVDVYPEEPVPVDSPARNTPNVLFTSHLAGGLTPSYRRIREMMLDDIGQILKGLPPHWMQPADPHRAAQMRSR